MRLDPLATHYSPFRHASYGIHLNATRSIQNDTLYIPPIPLQVAAMFKIPALVGCPAPDSLHVRVVSACCLFFLLLLQVDVTSRRTISPTY